MKKFILSKVLVKAVRYCLAILFLVFVSCDESNYNELIPIKYDGVSDENVQTLSNFAQEVSIALNDEEFRKALNVELKNDNNLEISKFFENSKLSKSINKHLNSSLNDITMNVPVNFHKFLDKKVKPLVVFLHEFDENQSYIEAYNPDGIKIQLDIRNEPDFPVLVINSENFNDRNIERQFVFDPSTLVSEIFDLSSLRTSKSLAVPSAPSNCRASLNGYINGPSIRYEWQDNSNDEFGFYLNILNTSFQGQAAANSTNGYITFGSGVDVGPFLSKDYNVVAVNGSGNSLPSNNSKIIRRAGNWEIGYKGYVINHSNIEHWLQGGPDLRLIVANAGGIIADKKWTGLKKSDINDKWCAWNMTLFRWDPTVHGTFLTFKWIEEDGGATTTLAIPIKDPNGNTVATVTTTVKDEDDDLGLQVINWSDNLTDIYNLGDFQFSQLNSNNL